MDGPRRDVRFTAWATGTCNDDASTLCIDLILKRKIVDSFILYICMKFKSEEKLRKRYSSIEIQLSIASLFTKTVKEKLSEPGTI